MQTALVLLESAHSLPGATGTCAQQPPRSPWVQPYDPRVVSSSRIAVQLDLARVLAAAGCGRESIALYDVLRQQGAVRQDDFGATLSYGMAYHQVDG